MTQTKPAHGDLSIDEMLHFYTADGALVPLPEGAARQRADDLATRMAVLEAELRVLHGEETQS